MFTVKVSKKDFAFFWSRKNPPKTITLKYGYSLGAGHYYILTCLPCLNGTHMKLIFHDENNAYYKCSRYMSSIISVRHFFFRVEMLPM